MTAKEAEALGYTIVRASAYEVGLLKNGKGIRTWWANDFHGNMPTLEDSKVQDAIKVNEEWSQ